MDPHKRKYRTNACEQQDIAGMVGMIINALHKIRIPNIDRFIGDMMRQPEIITTFDPILWSTMVERVTVYSKMDVRFTFRNGTEIAA